jgi:hypothetical protein
LSIAEGDDGRVLLNCHAGCTVEEVVSSIGLELQDLFPPRPIEHARSIKRPFLPSTVFELARQEIGIAAVIASDMHHNKTVSDEDYERLYIVVERLNEIGRSAYGR